MDSPHGLERTQFQWCPTANRTTLRFAFLALLLTLGLSSLHLPGAELFIEHPGEKAVLINDPPPRQERGTESTSLTPNLTATSIPPSTFDDTTNRARKSPCLDAPPPRDNPRLPKIIHVVNARLKATQTQDLNKTTLNAWKRLFPEPEFQYIIWTDENIRPFIQTYYGAFLSSFDKIKKPIVRIDVIRIIALHYFGGLYSDLDIEPHTNFWDRLPDDMPAIAESPWMGSKLQNSLMSSPPKHAFWTLAMNVVEERVSGDLPITLIAGPGCMDEAHKRLQERLGQKVFALPCKVFNRLGPTWVRKSGIYWDSEGIMRWAEDKGNISEAWRDCGDPGDPRCQWSVHEGACSWCER